MLAQREIINISIPGPQNFSYLPFDLISKLHIDHEYNVELKIKYVGGGGVAISDLVSHAVSFAAAGLPAVYSQMKNGEKVMAIAAIEQDPLFVLLVNKKFAKKVKSISDLKGLKIGVTSGSSTSKTTTQQTLEILLKNNNVLLDDVNIVPAGQSWESHLELINSGFIDAVVCGEPCASRMLMSKNVYVLFDILNTKGQSFFTKLKYIDDVLVTRSNIMRERPELPVKMIQMLKKTFSFIGSHTPQEIADVYYGTTKSTDKEILIKTLLKNKTIYTADGSFSPEQVINTKKFLERALDDKNIELEKVIEYKFIHKIEVAR